MWPLKCCRRVSCNLVSSAQSSAAGVHPYRCSSGAKPPLFFGQKHFLFCQKIYQLAGTILLAPDFVSISHRGETNSKGFAAHSQLEPPPTPWGWFDLGVGLCQSGPTAALAFFGVSHVLLGGLGRQRAVSGAKMLFGPACATMRLWYLWYPPCAAQQGKARQGRAGQGRTGKGRTGQLSWVAV